MTIAAPALDDLRTDPRTQSLSFDDLERFVAEPGVGVVVVAGAPGRRAETQDVAVVLRELMRDRRHLLRLAVIDGTLDDATKERWGLRIEPSLMFIRNGAVVEIVPGIRDWAVYVDRFNNLLRGAV